MFKIQRLRRPASRRHGLGIESLEPRTMFAVSDLDLTFNGTGSRTLSFLGPTDIETATAVAVQPDGKIVAAGTFVFNGGEVMQFAAASNFVVARFNNDGSLDTSFGDGGRVVINTDGENEKATCLTVQDDGKIVIGGFTAIGNGDDFVVARLNTNGALDRTFDGDGLRYFDFAGGGTNLDRAFGITTQTINGTRRIVVVGLSDQSNFGRSFDVAVLRLNDNGTQDLAFSQHAGGSESAKSVEIDSQNRIVVGGNNTDIDGNTSFLVMRFTPAGGFDSLFNGGSAAVIDFGGSDTLSAIQVVAGDKIVAAGNAPTSSASFDFFVARLNENGTLDTAFNALAAPTMSNGNGKLDIDFGATDFSTGLAVQSDGKLIVSGSSNVFGGPGLPPGNLAVARVTTAGKLDTSFNQTGTRTYDLGSNENVNAVVLDSLDRIVLAGFRIPPDHSSQDFVLARILTTENLGNVLTLANRVLTFTDMGVQNNNLTITRTATALTFTDSAAPIIDPSGKRANTVSVPLSLINRLVVNTAGGNDRVRVNIGATGFAFTQDFHLDLGTGRDTLIAAGNTNFTVSNTKLIAGTASGTLSKVDRVVLQGGASANTLDARGFSGAAVLDGGVGNDTLLAGIGRSILIGGKGVDTLTGGKNQDILIGGTTTLDILAPTFDAFVDKWAGPGTYAARVAALRKGTGLPAGLKLDATTVPNDRAADTLTGATELDWFWAYTLDFVKDKTAGELQN